MKTVTLLFVAVLVSLGGRTVAPLHHEKSNPGFALVELFTSEGCSSCPAADDALARIAKTYPDQVYTLEFHVDYWNRLGWKDIFSSPEWSQRQQQYANRPGADGVYTPQAIINGTQHVVGSEEETIRHSIDALIKVAPASSIDLTDVQVDGKKITLKYTLNSSSSDVIHFALVQLHGQARVTSGENRGRALEHHNIVRDFRSSKEKSGNVELTLPPSVSAGDCSLIAYAQDERSWHVNAAVRYPLHN